VDDLQLEAPVEALLKLDWIGQLNTSTGEPARYVLLANPETTPLMPLVNLLLLQPAQSLDFVRKMGLQPNGVLREAL
jgi:membrane protein